MAPGAKSGNLNLKEASMKRQKWSRPLPFSMFSDLSSTSKNQFGVLAYPYESSRNVSIIDVVLSNSFLNINSEVLDHEQSQITK